MEQEIIVEKENTEQEINIEKENINMGTEPQGTLDISENGIYDVKTYATADVSIPDPILQNKSIIIDTNGEVTIQADEGYYGLQQVNITTDVVGGYSITVNVTGGTYSGATTTYNDNEAHIYITPDSGKHLVAENITVANASFEYSSNTIKVFNATGDVTITALCESYHAVKCLIATGTQYILTDYVPNANTRVEMEMYKSSWAEQWDSMWGSENAFTFMQYGWSMQNTQLQLEMWGNSQPTGIDIQFDTKIKVTLDASVPLFEYGDYTYTPTFGSYTPTAPLTIFAKRRNNSTYVDHYSNYKLYYFKIYENNVLVRDYAPALDENGTPCLYETLSNTCLYNVGTGTFSYEP